MKNVTCLYIFLFLLSRLNSQIPVWNVETDVAAANSIPQGSLQLLNNQFLFYAQKRIIAFNQDGIITAAEQGTAGNTVNAYGDFIREKIDPVTEKAYFLLGASRLGSANVLTIGEYQPGIGFIHDTILDETIMTTAKSPFFLALNDSVFFVLGKKYFRRITHHYNHYIEINWQQNNPIGAPSGGVLTDTSIIGITVDGHLFALDTLGNVLWDNITAAGGFTHLEQVADGFLACTRLSGSVTASVVKFSTDGTLLWNRNFTDRSYETLLAETDGSITVAGQSDSLFVVLHHLDADGNTIWRKMYQKGLGTALLRTPDGGYLLAGITPANRYLAIKTDDAGFTSPVVVQRSAQSRKLENSILSVDLLPSATLFFNNIESTFLVPKEQMTTLFFAAAPWLGAVDQDSVLHFAASTYPNDGRSDYRPGLTVTESTDLNRVWAISRTELEALQQDWLDNNVIDQPVPNDLLTWPAKGNADFIYSTFLGESTMDEDLLPAPFIDLNGDGKYSVYDGDYPRIKGDQMAWWVLTDNTVHSRTNGVPFMLDMSISVYAYDCAPADKLNNSLFVDFECINRSATTYTDMRAGIWSDPDLGCAADDYIGSLPAANSFYVYNQDPIDGQPGATCPGTTATTFGDTIPIGSIRFTNATLNKFMYYNNGGGNPPPPVYTADPDDAREYNYYLQGKFRDGSPLTYNGQPIDFAFPDNPADPTGNSMCAANLVSGDRRMIGVHGPFDFAAGDTFSLHTIFTYHPAIPLPCPDIPGTVKTDLEELQNLIDAGILDRPANLRTPTKLQAGQSALLDATVPGALAYAWSNGATSPTITTSQPGTYGVNITRATGCTFEELAKVEVATSTENMGWPEQLQVFPNPTSGQFTVDVPGTARENVEFTLVNAVGQILQRQALNFNSSTLRQVFDYSRLPVGIYTLQMRSAGQIRYAKIVLQR